MSGDMWSCHGFGLIIDDYDTAEKIVKANCEKDKEVDVYDFFNGLGNTIIIDNSTSGNTVSMINESDCVKEINHVFFAICIYADNQPRAFTLAYKNSNEVVEEFEKKLQFPKNFSIEDHLGYFDCVMY